MVSDPSRKSRSAAPASHTRTKAVRDYTALPFRGQRVGNCREDRKPIPLTRSRCATRCDSVGRLDHTCSEMHIDSSGVAGRENGRLGLLLMRLESVYNRLERVAERRVVSVLRSILILVVVAFLSVQAPIRSSCLAPVASFLTETCHAEAGEPTAEHPDDSIDGDPIDLSLPATRMPSSTQTRPLAHSSGLPHKSLSVAPAEQPPRWS
jgi:hypothetical protein